MMLRLRDRIEAWVVCGRVAGLVLCTLAPVAICAVASPPRSQGVVLGWVNSGPSALEDPDSQPNTPARAASQRAAEPDQLDRMGWATKIALPITGQTYKQVQRFAINAMDRAAALHKKPVLIFEFRVHADQADFGRGSEFGAAYQLADFLSSEKLNAATTVAFLPQKIQGHAVLVALACDEIVMAKDAELGAAGIDELVITPTILLTYKDIANRRKAIPAEVAMALVDSDREVLVAQTDYGTEYVSREGLEDLKKQRAVQPNPEVLIRAGRPAQFSGAEARQHGFVNYLASDLRGVAGAMDLPPEAIQQDPSLGAQWRAARVDLKGPIRADSVDKAQRMIEEAIRRRDVNLICLWIDSPGGSPADSMRLASFLADDLDPSRVRTVAYVSAEARADAALIGLACDQLVMGPGAILGGEGDYAFSQQEIESVRMTFRGAIAPKKSRSWSLGAALIDPDLEVFRYVRFGDTKYSQFFSEEEAGEQTDPTRWKKGERVTTPGKPLELTGQQAADYWLADFLAEDFAQLKRQFGLEKDPALMEPSWADFLVRALASESLAILLLILGFGALYVELQVPGIGVGGFVAAVCFLLFFWSRFLGGTAGWLEVTLFAAGLACLLLELFVLPGFGIFGLGGGLMMLASLVLASQTFIVPGNAYQVDQLRNSLLILMGAVAGVVAAVALIHRWLPQVAAVEPLVEPGQEPRSPYEDLVGATGKTTTQLTPSGKARVGGRLLDVIADCEFVQRGQPIEVVEVQGNRIVVRSVNQAT